MLWVDGQKVGRVSNLRFPRAISVDRFGAGIHVYRLTLDVYGLDGSLQLNPNGQVTGVGHLLVRDGDAFSVQYVPGSSPRLVREPPPRSQNHIHSCSEPGPESRTVLRGP